MADKSPETQVHITVRLGDADAGPSPQIAQSEIEELSIVSELDNPDSCSILLNASGVAKQGKTLKLTGKMFVMLSHQGTQADAAFAGEITGLEPIFAKEGKAGGTMIVRGLNAMHSLSRGKHSVAYGGGSGKITDSEIVRKIKERNAPAINAVEFGEGSEPVIQYDHVYQHNQTDLEFLRHRAARIGYYILVRDKKLIFKKRTGAPGKLTFNFGTANQKGFSDKPLQLNRFVPRLSTANQVSEVRVRAWQPEKRLELVCIAKAGDPKAPPPMGTETGTDATKSSHPDAPLVRVDIPFSSKDEGDAIALSLLNERLMSYVTAEGSTPGDPSVKAGEIVKITVGDARFDGNYLITYVRHWYKHDGHTPFTTDFRARRDATKQAAK